MLRTVFNSDWDWQMLYNQLNHISWWSDNDLVIFPFPAWQSKMAITNFHSATNSFDRKAFLAGIAQGDDTMIHKKSVQKAIYPFRLRRHVPFDFEAFLRMKLCHLTSREEAVALAKVAVRRLPSIVRTVPPCVIFCWIETLCNAWPTARRFQGPPSTSPTSRGRATRPTPRHAAAQAR